MKLKHKILLFFIVSLVIASLIYEPKESTNKKVAPIKSEPTNPKLSLGKTGSQKSIDFSIENDDKIKNESSNTPPGVNTNFRDKPDFQVKWMKHGQDVVLKNSPDAESANFRNTFFHRGFKDRPVTCGEVAFTKDNEIIDDYQKFIYVGIQSTYLENELRNFDIYWSKMCVETFEE